MILRTTCHGKTALHPFNAGISLVTGVLPSAQPTPGMRDLFVKLSPHVNMIIRHIKEWAEVEEWNMDLAKTFLEGSRAIVRSGTQFKQLAANVMGECDLGLPKVAEGDLLLDKDCGNVQHVLDKGHELKNELLSGFHSFFAKFNVCFVRTLKTLLKKQFSPALGGIIADARELGKEGKTFRDYEAFANYYYPACDVASYEGKKGCMARLHIDNRAHLDQKLSDWGLSVKSYFGTYYRPTPGYDLTETIEEVSDMLTSAPRFSLSCVGKDPRLTWTDLRPRDADPCPSASSTLTVVCDNLQEHCLPP